ncbi:MAG: uracil-DNA glycosylase [Acetobacteraceae bacterium]
MDDLAALRLQIEWGADEALEVEPVDRLHVQPPPEPSPASTPSPAASTPSPVERGRVGEGAGTAAERATQAAAGAHTLADLRAAISGFDGCALRDTASNLVFAEGDPSSGLLLIGDAPGADDDRSGVPFAGAPGAYLDRMLASIGLARAGLLLSPLIPWRPPGDRPPSPTELAICLPFLFRLVALAAPRRIVLLGPLAPRALLVQTTRRRPRGAWLDASIPGLSQALPALPTFSPGELMRTPRDRRSAWADLRLLRRTLDADVAKK